MVQGDYRNTINYNVKALKNIMSSISNVDVRTYFTENGGVNNTLKLCSRLPNHEHLGNFRDWETKFYDIEEQLFEIAKRDMILDETQNVFETQNLEQFHENNRSLISDLMNFKRDDPVEFGVYEDYHKFLWSLVLRYNIQQFESFVESEDNMNANNQSQNFIRMVQGFMRNKGMDLCNLNENMCGEFMKNIVSSDNRDENNRNTLQNMFKCYDSYQKFFSDFTVSQESFGWVFTSKSETNNNVTSQAKNKFAFLYGELEMDLKTQLPEFNENYLKNQDKLTQFVDNVKHYYTNFSLVI